METIGHQLNLEKGISLGVDIDTLNGFAHNVAQSMDDYAATVLRHLRELDAMTPGSRSLHSDFQTLQIAAEGYGLDTIKNSLNVNGAGLPVNELNEAISILDRILN